MMPFVLDNLMVVAVVLVLAGIGITLSVILVRNRARSAPGVPLYNHPVVRTVRVIIGWPVLVMGILITPLPIPIGLMMVALGTVLIGTRTWVIRWAFVNMRLLLRRWSQIQQPVVGDTGRFLWNNMQQVSRKARQRRLRNLPPRTMLRQKVIGSQDAYNNLSNPENEAAG
jgi:hypothetical protein